MTPDQLAKFKALSYCTFLVGSPDKFFVNSQNGATGKELTDKQADYLDRLIYRYRRQLLKRFHMLARLEQWIADGKAKCEVKAIEEAHAKLQRETGTDLRHYWLSPNSENGKGDERKA